jgi:hypothetical protein
MFPNVPFAFPRVPDWATEIAKMRPFCRVFLKPSSGLEPGTPPYHGTTQATGRNPRQRFSLVWAVLEAVPFASDCHELRPLGSIKAPRLVAYVGYDVRNWTSASAGAFAKATLAPKERAGVTGWRRLR